MARFIRHQSLNLGCNLNHLLLFEEMKLDLTEHGYLTPTQRKLLNEIAADTRSSFVGLVNELGKGYENCIDWWISEIASRNTISSSLFNDICYAVFATRLLKLEPSITSIVVDSPALCKVLRNYCTVRKLKISIGCTASWLNRLSSLFKSMKIQILSLAKIVLQFGVCKLLYPPSHRKLPQNLTLVDTFIYDSCFKNGGYIDRYYNNFGGYLSETEQAKFYYMPTFTVSLVNTINCIRSIRNAPQNFILREDFLRLIDYIYAFLYPIRALKLFPKSAQIMGLNVTPLVRSTWIHHLLSPSSITALLMFRFAKRLKQKRLSIRLVIDWFENQIIDKGGNAGFRRFFPETPLIGYQGFFGSKYYLCLYPTRKEAECGVLPDTVFVCGQGLKEERKEFFNDLKVSAAPAFRFRGVWGKRKFWPNDQYYTILITLPLWKTWIDIIQLAIKIPTLQLPKHTRFWVKPHPASGSFRHKLRELDIILPDIFEVVDQSFDVLSEKSDIIIGNNSSTCLEALVKGVPIIIMGIPLGLTQIPIPDGIPRELWKVCYTAQEIGEGINHFAYQSESQKEHLASLCKEIREAYFTPVTRESVRKFLQLEKTN